MSKTTSKSRFSRLLPKFLRGDKSNKTEGSIDSKTPFCFIHFLDDSHHQIQIKGNWKGSLLQEKVCELLSLHEKDYFGLRFIDTAGQTHWLDGNKSLSSQFKGCQTPHKLYFGVKFYAADPCKLREEITRYLFFLQVKQDILQGRLPVTFDEAAELCAYAVQSELGDFDPHQNTAGYVSEFCFVPNQTEELERRIAAIHRRLGGMVPLMAEYRYLDKVKWLDMYGVDLHPVMGEGNVEYFLGLTPTGIVVYKNKNKVGNYFWPRINKVTFKGKIFIVKVKDKNNEEHAYAFELPRKTACKHLWKCCVEHHAFFSGRSERQAVSDNLSRHPSNVVRLPSRRQPRRINSDSKLNSPENYESQYDHDTGMVTMLMRPEPVRAPRHHSLPELQGHESPRSTKSAPWETNFDYGLYTHGKDSPVSERSNKMREQRNRAMTGSDSESGISQRRKYFPNRRGSDNDSDVSVTRRRRRDIDSDSASDISSRYPASHSHKSAFPVLYPFHDKENRPNGSIPSLHSAPAGESKQRRRRRRSKSPGKRPPEELKQHFEYGLKDTEGLSTEELKEIPFVNIETKASLFKLKYSPKLRQKVKAAKQKSLGDLDQNRNQVMKRQTSAPLDDEMDRAASVHSQPISRKDPEDRDSTSYTQSGGPYDSDNNNNNTARRRKDRRQDQNSDTARNNTYRNSGRQSRGHLQEQDQLEQDGRMEAEYECLQQQQVPDSRMDGSASRPGQVRGDGQQVVESYSGYQYRDGSSEQTHYMAPPPASQGAPPPYQVHQSSNVSYSSFTSPPQNYYHHHHHHQQQQQQQPPRRSASTVSPYANPPSQNYHNSGRVSPYNSMAPHGHYDQGQRPRSYGQDDDGRSKLYHDEGHKPREREGDWSRGYSQEKGQRSRYRDDGDRPRLSFHEEHLARPPRPPYQGEPQRNQYDHRSPSGYQHNTSNYQPPPRQYQQQSPQPQYQGAPARHQGTPPRHQGTPPRQQGTPPRQQGTPPRQPVFSTPPRQSMDPRYSQGLVSMHAREQSEGSSSQASVLGGGNYHRSPRPSPAHSGSDRSGSRNLGNSLTSEQTRQLLRSPNYNPDLCTEL